MRPSNLTKAPTVPHSRCGLGARWCARSDVMFDVPGMHVIDVQIDDEQRLVLTVESDQLEHGCPACGVLAVGHGRRCRTLHDAPCLGRVTVLRWLTRAWRCLEPGCATTTFTEQHPIAPPRSVLTVRSTYGSGRKITKLPRCAATLTRSTPFNSLQMETTSLPPATTPLLQSFPARHASNSTSC
jgi:hypothetical protein